MFGMNQLETHDIKRLPSIYLSIYLSISLSLGGPKEDTSFKISDFLKIIWHEQHTLIHNGQRVDDVSGDVTEFTMTVSAFPDTPSELDKVTCDVITDIKSFHHNVNSLNRHPKKIHQSVIAQLQSSLYYQLLS